MRKYLHIIVLLLLGLTTLNAKIKSHLAFCSLYEIQIDDMTNISPSFDINSIEYFEVDAHKYNYRLEWQVIQRKIVLADVNAFDELNSKVLFFLSSLTIWNTGKHLISSYGTLLPGVIVNTFGSGNGIIEIGLSGFEGNCSEYTNTGRNYYGLFYTEGYVYDETIMWEDAATILLSGDVKSINAYLTEVNGGNGAGVLPGIITSNTGSPLSGVMVSILDQFNNVVNYTMSNAQGNYSIQGLGSGDFDIIVSKVKFNSENNSLHTNLDEDQDYEMNFNLAPSVTEVEEKISESVPVQLTLKNNYPNPFNPTTTIGFDIPIQSYVKQTVFNLIGEERTNLVNKILDAGTHNFSFDASSLNSGIYFYQLHAGEFNSVRKMILMK